MKRAILAGTAFLVFYSHLQASVTGSISGTILDPTGAVIPGAKVVAINTETDSRQTTESNAQGFYSFPALPVGHYDVDIQARGFKD
jgi:Carboxypeptidase regulatory-like domain